MGYIGWGELMLLDYVYAYSILFIVILFFMAYFGGGGKPKEDCRKGLNGICNYN